MPSTGDVGISVSDADAQLVARLRAGERGAYEDVVHRYTGRMLAVARRFVREPEDARDIVQEAFISAFRRELGTTPGRYFAERDGRRSP